jgi:hypothetical protein
LSATIPNETAPSKAIPTHKAFVCHAGLSFKVSMAFLRIAAATHRIMLNPMKFHKR